MKFTIVTSATLQTTLKETDIAEPPYDFVLCKTGELIFINEELLQVVA